MKRWPIDEIHELSKLIVHFGECWMVNDTLERLAADELSLPQAIELLEWFHSEIVNSIEHGY